MSELSITITREIKKVPNTKDSVALSPIKATFRNDAPSCQQKDVLTSFGYKVLITSLAETITNFAKAAAMNGFSEGEIISDAIKQLERDLIDTDYGLPSLTTKQWQKKKGKKKKNNK